jgi:carboxylesterase
MNTPKSRFHRVVRNIVIVLALFALSMICYACASQRALRKYIATLDRDPITGIVAGTEAVTLDPPKDSASTDTACLMIHGFLAARDVYGDLGERIAKRGVTVRMVRLPGHGTTPADLAYLPKDAFYRTVLAEYDTLAKRYKKIRVVGFSLGGALATRLASERPVDRLVLLAPYYKVTYRWWYILPVETWQRLVGWTMPYTIRPHGACAINDKSQIGKFFMYQIIPMGGVRRLAEAGTEARDPERLRKITCPVLWIHSVNDIAASYNAALWVFAHINSTAKEHCKLEKSSHVLCWDYDREQVKQATVRFICSEQLRF